MTQFFEKQLDNGLRLCVEQLDHLPSAACGFMVRTGARDETAEEEGVSHFLEHMCFKGTPNATWEQINQRFDDLGSKYNAFTGHEKTMYYGWVPEQNLAPQIDLLADMMRSSIPQEEFDTEKNVILEEIAMYRDSLQSCMFDLASTELFKGSPLELSVLGTNETIEPLRREQMVDYHRRRYGPENMVFIATGRVNPDAVLAQLERLTAEWEQGKGGRDQSPPQVRLGAASKKNEKFKQQAIMLCYPAPSGRENDARVTVLSRLLSGDNSRIYWDVIQKGVCANAGAFHLNYSDVGVFVLYALCEPDRADAVVSALREQAEIVTRKGVTASEVQRVRNAMRTNVARDGDAPMRRLLQLASDIDMLGKPLALEQHMAEIEAVKVDDIQSLIEAHPITGDCMTVSVGPETYP